MKPILCVLALLISLSLAPTSAQGADTIQPSATIYVPAQPWATYFGVSIGVGSTTLQFGSASDVADLAAAAEPTFTATWKSSGVTIIVTVPKKPDESSPAWAARCVTVNEAFLKAFPKDKEPPTTSGRI